MDEKMICLYCIYFKSRYNYFMHIMYYIDCCIYIVRLKRIKRNHFITYFSLLRRLQYNIDRHRYSCVSRTILTRKSNFY